MKQIKAFTCDHCKKILKSYSGMWKHEKKCFFNPDTKSCVTCEYLDQCKPTIQSNGIPKTKRILTGEEEEISQFQIEGTYITRSDDYEVYNVLDKEYKYLEEVEYERYCDAQKIILSKLRTNCKFHKVK